MNGSSGDGGSLSVGRVDCTEMVDIMVLGEASVV